jgi:hypothetical protein
LSSSADYTGSVSSKKVKFILLFSFLTGFFSVWPSHHLVFAQITGCTITPPSVTIPDPGKDAEFQISLIPGPLELGDEFLFVWGQESSELGRNDCQNPPTGTIYNEIIQNGLPNVGRYWAKVMKGCSSPIELCGTSFQIGQVSGDSPMMPQDDRSFFICRDKQGNYRQECVNCITAGNWWTVLGCLPTNQANLVQTLVNLITGAAGGISFLLMIKGAFLMMTSQGDIYRLRAGKSSLTKGVAGLVIILFATVILRTIAADILRFPGFSQ